MPQYTILEVNIEKDLFLVEYFDPPQKIVLNIGIPRSGDALPIEIENHVFAFWPVAHFVGRKNVEAKGRAHADRLHPFQAFVSKNFTLLEMEDRLPVFIFS